MSAERGIVILGASARAAAFSALRAGLAPWCADLFADADLAARCPAVALPFDRYPHGFRDLVRQAPPGPWLFTGGLENRPRLVEQIARDRPLWGCQTEPLRAVRDPARLAHTFARFGIPFPEIRSTQPESADPRRWLAKPLDGAGGSGIAVHRPGDRPAGRVYYQEFVAGMSASAVYVGRPDGADLLGVTRQLVGEPWLNAKPFQYCGSLTPDRPPVTGFARIGEILARECGLRGLFGVDCILHDGVPWPVEVNPRYTASVEVIEWATGCAALSAHAAAFSPDSLPPRKVRPYGRAIGKAILFARRTFAFPADGPWRDVLLHPPAWDEPPPFADIPHGGSRIEAGWPVLTLFATAGTTDGCLADLKRTAADLERQFGRED